MGKAVSPMIPLSDLTFINPPLKLLRGEPYPFIAMENIEPGRRYVHAQQTRILPGSGSKFLPGDTLFARITPCLENGKIAQYDPRATGAGSGSTEFIVIRARPVRADPAFVYYLSMTDWVRGPAEKSMAGASGRQRADTVAIANAKVPLLDIDTQCRIASILSAYDDLIENNSRRISILEEMARRLYEEWFVRFRFPGHETARFVKTEIGRVPDKWRIASIAVGAALINRGIAPKYDDTASTLVISQKCIRNQRLSLEPARRQCKPVPDERIVRSNDVLINSTGIGTLGRVAQAYHVPHGTTVDSHVTIVRPSKDVNAEYFGHTLLRLESYFDKQGVGSTGQTELSRARIAETQVLLPPSSIQNRFGEFAHPIRHLAYSLEQQNTGLRDTRDLLLPKLISGEIDVNAAPMPAEIAAQ